MENLGGGEQGEKKERGAEIGISPDASPPGLGWEFTLHRRKAAPAAVGSGFATRS